MVKLSMGWITNIYNSAVNELGEIILPLFVDYKNMEDLNAMPIPQSTEGRNAVATQLEDQNTQMDRINTSPLISPTNYLKSKFNMADGIANNVVCAVTGALIGLSSGILTGSFTGIITAASLGSLGWYKGDDIMHDIVGLDLENPIGSYLGLER